LGQKLRQLWRRVSRAHGWAAQEKLMKQAQRIEDIVVSRNLKGIEHEKAGRVAKAVTLYEANVADRFDGSHPYDRLRVIYTREEKFEDAIHICEAYIQFGQERDVGGKAKYGKAIENLKRKLLERRR
jgi:hypothetical protein